MLKPQSDLVTLLYFLFMQAERIFSFDDKSDGDSIEVRIPEVIDKYFVLGLPFTLCTQKKKLAFCHQVDQCYYAAAIYDFVCTTIKVAYNICI